MIIVKTQTGLHFVNDKAVRKVWHDKNNAKVWITDMNGGIENIADVEMVTYTSDMMKVDYQDKGRWWSIWSSSAAKCIMLLSVIGRSCATLAVNCER